MKKTIKRYLNGIYKRLAYVRKNIGYFNKREKKILELKATHEGESCFVIGNGPSLKAEDLEKASKQGFYTFSCNKIYKMFGSTDWRPDFYACIDEEVFMQNYEDIFENITCPSFINYRFANTIKKYYEAAAKTRENIFLPTYYSIKGKMHFFPQAANITSGGSVTFYLIELAHMMGFKNIYLIGCDHNYSSFQKDNRLSVEKFASDADTNMDYFAPDYMKPGEVIRVGDLDRSASGYKAAKEYIEAHGGHIYNATRGGKLEVFERVNLDELLNKGDI